MTQRPLWVLGALIFFKATTIPIVLGTIVGFYKFFRKDDSVLNTVKAAPDIDAMNITNYPE